MATFKVRDKQTGKVFTVREKEQPKVAPKRSFAIPQLPSPGLQLAAPAIQAGVRALPEQGRDILQRIVGGLPATGQIAGGMAGRTVGTALGGIPGRVAGGAGAGILGAVGGERAKVIAENVLFGKKRDLTAGDLVSAAKTAAFGEALGVGVELAAVPLKAVGRIFAGASIKREAFDVGLKRGFKRLVNKEFIGRDTFPARLIDKVMNVIPKLKDRVGKQIGGFFKANPDIASELQDAPLVKRTILEKLSRPGKLFTDTGKLISERGRTGIVPAGKRLKELVNTNEQKVLNTLVKNITNKSDDFYTLENIWKMRVDVDDLINRGKGWSNQALGILDDVRGSLNDVLKSKSESLGRLFNQYHKIATMEDVVGSQMKTKGVLDRQKTMNFLSTVAKNKNKASRAELQVLDNMLGSDEKFLTEAMDYGISQIVEEGESATAESFFRTLFKIVTPEQINRVRIADILQRGSAAIGKGLRTTVPAAGASILRGLLKKQ